MKYLAFKMTEVQDRKYLHPEQGSCSTDSREASSRENHLITEPSGRLGVCAFYLKGAGRNSSRVRLNVEVRMN